jgi:flagellar hook-associated protein 2
MQEITVEPGSTLNDVAKVINDGASGVQATVLRTASDGDAFKLILRSEKTGEIQNFLVDGDTSELEFDQVRPASNLKASFEGVSIERDSNQIDDLLSGLKIDIKKGSEGSTVGFKVDTDIDKTKLSIKGFAEQYNKIVQLSSGQVSAEESANGGASQTAPASGAQSGSAASPRIGRDIVRRLQSVLSSQFSAVTGEVQTLAQVGITTNAKSGELMVDENKLENALRADFDGVAGLFVMDELSGKKGLAGRLSDVVRDLRNSEQGAVGSRIKTLDRQILDQDRHIAQKTEALADKEQQLRRQFESAEQRIQKMNQQAEQMSAMTGTRPSGGGGNQ